MVVTRGNAASAVAPERDLHTARSALIHATANILRPHRAELAVLGVDFSGLLERVVDLALGDLFALVHRDPASQGSWEYVLESYACFHAVLAHRVGHDLLTAAEGSAHRRRTLARTISETAKVRTGVEIHPGATIGPRFVVDHGMGTVIGEDTTIGADCYVLQGVVLGARGIADNAPGRRHPTLGDRVQVGGFARVLGPVTVGDDVIIGGHALICADVPAGAHVAVRHPGTITHRARTAAVPRAASAG
jgi:serine O-acetyltransferase